MSKMRDARAQQGQVPPPLSKAVVDLGNQDMIKGMVPPPLPPAHLFQSGEATSQGQSSNSSGGTTQPKK